MFAHLVQADPWLLGAGAKVILGQTEGTTSHSLLGKAATTQGDPSPRACWGPDSLAPGQGMEGQCWAQGKGKLSFRCLRGPCSSCLWVGGTNHANVSSTQNEVTLGGSQEQRHRIGEAAGAGAGLDGLGRDQQDGSQSIPSQWGVPGAGSPRSRCPEASHSAPPDQWGSQPGHVLG